MTSQQQQQSVQPSSGRSVMTIRVGTGSNAADTGSSGGGGKVQTDGPSLAAVSPAAAADAGRHDNASQQPADVTRSAVIMMF